MSSAQAQYSPASPSVSSPFPSPVSNPQRVLTMIDAGGKNLSSLFNRLAEPPASSPEPPSAPAASHLKLHVAPEQSAPPELDFDWAGPKPVPPQQAEQLVKHLRNRQRDLEQREADLQAAVYRWEQKAMVEDARYRKRTGELEQHLGHVKAQQEQLVKLQQNLIDSQTALRQAIETIVDDSQPRDLKAALETLKTELNETMDAVLTRWEKISTSFKASGR